MYFIYDRVSLAGDFNTEISEYVMGICLYHQDLTNFVKDKSCFKNASNPSNIDLFFANNSLAFQNTTTTITHHFDSVKLV